MRACIRHGCDATEVFSLYMDGVVMREVNASVCARSLYLSEHGKTKTTLIADTKVKLRRLVSEFGIICDRRT